MGIMRVVIICFVVVCFGFVTSALRCWTCNAPGYEECARTGSVERCVSAFDVCTTLARRNHDRLMVTKRCKQRLACRNEENQNNNSARHPQCNHNGLVSFCRCCCTESLCNVGATCDAALPVDFLCHEQGGVCQEWRNITCPGGYVPGLCDGNNGRRCCLPCTPQTCPIAQDAVQQDMVCQAEGGHCLTNTNFCDGLYYPGKCGGPNGRQCCKEAVCTLLNYINTNVKPRGSDTIRINYGFKWALSKMNDWAKACRVKVRVTKSFEEVSELNSDYEPIEPVIPNNYVVGHAVDIEVDTTIEVCDGACLARGNNPQAVCFLKKVLDYGLHWGGMSKYPNPSRIEDQLNLNNPIQWRQQFFQLQKGCKST